MNDAVYNKYVNGKYQETIVPDGTHFIADGDDFICITPGGYKFKVGNFDDVIFLGKGHTNGQTI